MLDRILRSAFYLSMFAGPVLAQQVGPEASVYLVAKKEGPVQGVATLISSKKGIFLTASHVVDNAGTLVLKRDDQAIRFRVLLRGNNIARSVEDWAILQADPDDWRTGALRPSLPVIYDLPNASEMASAAILSGPNRSSNFAATEWNVKQESPCGIDSVILAQTTRYDRGFSGASVVVNGSKKGVVAITSRFETVNTEQDSETIQLFAKLTRAIEQEQGDGSPINSSVLRDLIKDRVFVKTVPVKCIFDQIISKESSRLKMFETDKSEVLEEIQLAIAGAMPEDQPQETRETKLIEIMNALGSANLSIIEVMQLLDKFVTVFKDSKNTIDVIKMQLFGGIMQNSQKIYAYHLPAAYVKAATASPSPPIFMPDLSGVPLEPAKDGGVIEKFLKTNSQWAYGTGVTQVQFDLSLLPKPNVDRTEALNVGNQISKILSNPQLVKAMTPQTKAQLENSAVVYLANGLNSATVRSVGTSRLDSNFDVVQGVGNLADVLKSTAMTGAFGPWKSAGSGVADRLKNLSLAGQGIYVVEEPINTKVYVYKPIDPPSMYMMSKEETVGVAASEPAPRSDVFVNPPAALGVKPRLTTCLPWC